MPKKILKKNYKKDKFQLIRFNFFILFLGVSMNSNPLSTEAKQKQFHPETGIQIFDSHYVDHLALGIHNLDEGLKWIKEKTGVDAYVVPPEPGQWYQSAGLLLGENVILEIIAPNPNHKGYHPIKQVLKSYSKPNLFFWYLGVKNFDEFEKFAKKEGIKIERIEKVEYVRNSIPISYQRATVGPGFFSERPNIIEWKAREDRSKEKQGCRLLSFWIESSEPELTRELFQKLKIDIQVFDGKGKSKLFLKIDTPKGEIILSGDSESFRGIEVPWKMLKGYWNFLLY
jgi:hypothetical protein